MKRLTSVLLAALALVVTGCVAGHRGGSDLSSADAARTGIAGIEAPEEPVWTALPPAVSP